MMKHAYLIIAHNNPGVLNVLLSMIDDERNDVFLHLDKKSTLRQSQLILPKSAGFHLLKKQINVKWGGYSQVRTEMLLFKEAEKCGPYSYYHLLSGVDLPIKSQDYIHRFMDEHMGKEFISYLNLDNSSHEIKKRVGRYWVLENYFRTNNLLMKVIRKSVNLIVGLIPRKLDVEFRKGSNWVSLTQECVTYLISQEDYIERRFRYGYLVDEVFIQTMVYNNTDLRDRLYKANGMCGFNMRHVDWSRGHPYTFTSMDKEELRQSECLYARKFSDNDMEIVRWIQCMTQ